MIEHNKNFYSLEELKRTRDNLEGYLDNEEVYYFVGAIRYACDEIERLNNLVKGLREERDYLFNKTTTESNYEIERLNNIINELEKWLEEEKDRLARETSNIYEDSLGKTRLVNEDIFNEVTKIKSKLQELKGSDNNK